MQGFLRETRLWALFPINRVAPPVHCTVSLVYTRGMYGRDGTRETYRLCCTACWPAGKVYRVVYRAGREEEETRRAVSQGLSEGGGRAEQCLRVS